MVHIFLHYCCWLTKHYDHRWNAHPFHIIQVCVCGSGWVRFVDFGFLPLLVILWFAIQTFYYTLFCLPPPRLSYKTIAHWRLIICLDFPSHFRFVKLTTDSCRRLWRYFCKQFCMCFLFLQGYYILLRCITSTGYLLLQHPLHTGKKESNNNRHRWRQQQQQRWRRQWWRHFILCFTVLFGKIFPGFLLTLLRSECIPSLFVLCLQNTLLHRHNKHMWVIFRPHWAWNKMRIVNGYKPLQII